MFRLGQAHAHDARQESDEPCFVAQAVSISSVLPHSRRRRFASPPARQFVRMAHSTRVNLLTRYPRQRHPNHLRHPISPDSKNAPCTRSCLQIHLLRYAIRYKPNSTRRRTRQRKSPSPHDRRNLSLLVTKHSWRNDSSFNRAFCPSNGFLLKIHYGNLRKSHSGSQFLITPRAPSKQKTTCKLICRCLQVADYFSSI